MRPEPRHERDAESGDGRYLFALPHTKARPRRLSCVRRYDEPAGQPPRGPPVTDCRTFACANQGCQATIHLHHDIEAKLRRTHETFYCPAGHHNYFPGKTDAEKKLADAERRAARFLELWHDAVDDREDWKLRARTCPFGCGFRVLRKRIPENIEAALAFHLIEEHGAAMPVQDEATVA
jgi:hypothetical protein